MNASGRVVRAGVERHRVQTAVMALTTLIAVAASILAAGLLVTSQAPFDHAFAKEHGSQLTTEWNGNRVSAAELASSGHAAGVTAASGPFPAVTIAPVTGTASNGLPAGITLPPLNIVGRTNPGGPVDDVSLLSGRWVNGPGQIVLSGDSADGPFGVGTVMRFPAAPGDPSLTVVGIAQSVGQTADGWVTPLEAAALRAPGSVPSFQMLYRFAQAATTAEIARDRAGVVTAMPAGALTGSQSYLAIRQVANANTSAFVPFVTAFGILGFVLSALTIGIVISGAVAAATRRIGILKSLGFTPGQVGRAFMAQALVPATIGAGLGVVVGNLLSIPVFKQASKAYESGTLTVPVWIDIAVPAVALMAVAMAALAPALRAGRLRAAEAIAVGRTPRAGRGRLAHRVAGRLPLSRSVSLGLANPFARPGRSLTMAAAIALGAVTVTFAVGLSVSLDRVQTNRDPRTAGAVVVQAAPGPGGHLRITPGNGGSQNPTASRVASTIAAQSGTRAFFGTTSTAVRVSGLTGSTTVTGYQGDSSWANHPMISGKWLTGPGQAVVSPRLLTAASVRVGDRLTLTTGGRSTTVRIVGDVFELDDQGLDILTGTSTLRSLGLAGQPDQYNVELEPGTNLGAYLTSLNRSLGPLGMSAQPNRTEDSSVIAAMEAVISLLALLLVVAAGLGVLNSIVLDTRERVHDLGVLKAVGMTPRQTLTTILTSTAGLGLLAGIVGVPLGVAVHGWVLPLMARTVGEQLPAYFNSVYPLSVLLLLGLGGLVIAVGGAALPAGWAARTRTASALRTE
ncbi:MAG: ABC transporter permease [Acidimicrobiaceae bacterium]|nr:ABC transporter permease [Acidimicrobiaceae bacterium]